MARWLIVQEDGGVRLYYLNLITGDRFYLGDVDPVLSDEDVVSWIFTQGGPAYGDHIHLRDGKTLHFQQSAACA